MRAGLPLNVRSPITSCLIPKSDLLCPPYPEQRAWFGIPKQLASALRVASKLRNGFGIMMELKLCAVAESSAKIKFVQRL